jgi:MtN3 and saliva related transmembrane protein
LHTIEQLLGFLAAAFTTLSFVPQAVKIIREKQTAGISLIMYVVFTVGIALWLTYGLLTSNIPICVANGVTLVLAAVILGVKIRLG